VETSLLGAFYITENNNVVLFFFSVGVICYSFSKMKIILIILAIKFTNCEFINITPLTKKSLGYASTSLENAGLIFFAGGSSLFKTTRIKCHISNNKHSGYL